MRFQRLVLACAAGLTLHSVAAHAQLTVEITGAGANRLPVAIADFTGERIVAQALASVIRADLDRSGLFRLVDAGSPLADSATPAFEDLKAKGADAVAGGSVTTSADGRYETRVRLSDVPKQAALGNPAYLHTGAQLRATAHRIADFIYEKLTGEPGVFSTRIAYVVKSTGRYELKIADADGSNDQAALASREPIISPAWSPDGGKLAYVSFEAKKPVVYVHDLASGRRHVAANFKGSNSAPAWSPDGKQLAVVLTKDGSSQLYVVNADGSGATRLATSSGIDTEPRWSPDGQVIYFTSDRGGSPQIYRIATSGAGAGNPAERVTFEGSYNVTPRPSPDGKSLAFISRNNGRFQLALMDLATKQTQVLTDSAKDESPSFAPNGRMILYATEIGGRGVLAAVSSDGRVKQKLSVQAADVREPAWGPLVR
ncbi:Tol-Pal system beta propeller repeat protein TolB [Sulfuritalea hydrogenivorans]|jgi:TolB protein|uniref:Tol-Pal system protein TolB n=1 Tax=Sulfuritalea hydrogenivorans sk43H TaxID=1223802 RepID=W0SJ57_9PROT|nr:Tol-Pal system beta propeller repeat protein TolB [Sulfuritalea hydrogenivorans]MDK9713549.1 Tol-Pal system beta propeller repeat protein TolB [Sulfuritalea sp.]BAO31067.1 translocation protein TolB [Sulfuritalea hydrogenivorans sk43H]